MKELSRKELQQLCKELGRIKANIKTSVLIEELQAYTTDTEPDQGTEPTEQEAATEKEAEEQTVKEAADGKRRSGSRDPSPDGSYGWTGQESSSGFFDIARPALGVFASLEAQRASELEAEKGARSLYSVHATNVLQTERGRDALLLRIRISLRPALQLLVLLDLIMHTATPLLHAVLIAKGQQAKSEGSEENTIPCGWCDGNDCCGYVNVKGGWRNVDTRTEPGTAPAVPTQVMGHLLK
jgi:hypothetical protein